MRDHLDQRHHRRRVEEVQADHVGRALGGHRALDHRQAGRGGGQHHAGLADLVEAGEERLLDAQLLDHGLDDEVDVGQVVEVGRPGDPAQRRVAVGLGELAAHDALVERGLAAPRRPARTSPRPRVTRDDLVPGLGEDLDDAGGHRAGADHADLGDRPRRAVGGRPVRRGRRLLIGYDDRRARLLVRVEAAAGLAAEQPGGDHLLDQRHRGVPAVAAAPAVHGVEDLVRGVQADQVHQRERAHRQAAAELHGRVDVLAGGVAALEHRDGVVEVAEQQRVGDEAGPVADRDVDLAEPGAQRLHVGDHLGRGDHGADDLDQLHDRRRVEEVDADHLVGPVVATEISVTSASEVLVARIASRLADPVQLGEDPLLEVEVLGHRLDDEVDVAQRVQPDLRSRPGRAARRGRPAAELALGHGPVGRAGQGGPAALQRRAR